MTDLRKAAEMALERLESHEYWMDERAIQALRQALAQPEQEPVAWQDPQYKTLIEPHKAHSDWIPLYAAPPKREWVGLTDEDLKPLCNQWKIMYGGYVDDFARAIEAKLMEKNNG